MYAKTNPGQGKLSRRHKRVLAATGIAVVLGVGGLAAWGELVPDTYAGSSPGCVNVTIPNSMGGATLHYCGSAARNFCHDAFAGSLAPQVAVRATPVCRQAGLTR